MKSYILLTYEGKANHVLYNRNDFLTGLLDRQLLDEEPKIAVAKAEFENVKLRSKVYTLQLEIEKYEKTIHKYIYKKRVEETYHWHKNCTCKGSPYDAELKYTTDIQFVTCQACRLRAEKEAQAQSIRMLQQPLL